MIWTQLMPLRSEVLARRWSILDFPILPFLAPRVFQPWPPRGRRSHMATHKPVPRGIVHDGTSQSTKPSGLALQERAPQIKDVFKETPFLIPAARDESKAPCESGKPSDGASQTFPEASVELPPPTETRPDPGSPQSKKPEVWSKRKPGGLQVMERTRPIAEYRQKRLKRMPRSKREADRFFKYISNRRLAHRVELLRPPPKQYQLKVPHDIGNVPRFFSRYFNQKDPAHVFDLLRNTGGQATADGTEHYDEVTTNLIESLIVKQDSKSVHEVWVTLPEDVRISLWPKLIMWTLKLHPHKALKILSGTYIAPYPPPLAISDSLGYIIWHYLESNDPSPELSLFLTTAIKRILLLGPPDFVYLSQNSIWLLLSHLQQPRHIEKLYRSLEEINNPMTVHTLAQFASQLAKSGQGYEDIAFEILQRIGDTGEDFNYPSLQSLCSTILLASSHYTHSEKFAYMLKCGLRPNIITYNVLLLKTLKAHDHEGGWRIHEIMETEGPKPDAFTYSILLHDAKSRLDTTAMNRVMNAVKAKSIRDACIAGDTLHSLLLLNEQAVRRERYRAYRDRRQPRIEEKKCFDQMLKIYSEYFNIKPLAHLLPGFEQRYPQYKNLSPIVDSELDFPTRVLVDPPTAILVVMITALLKDYHDPDTPKWFYEHFSNLVRAGDPIIIDIASSRNGVDFSHIYNMVLLALGRHASNLPACLKIIGQMSSSGTKIFTINAPETGVSKSVELRIPKPSQVTWNVLIGIFMSNRQPRAAEKVISMMRERGLQPDDYTWNKMIRGYALMQDTAMVVDAVDRQERAGYKPDIMTVQSLKLLENRRALIDGMRRRKIEAMQKEIEKGEKEAEKAETVDKQEVMEEGDEFVLEDLPLREEPTKSERNMPVREEVNFGPDEQDDAALEHGMGTVDQGSSRSISELEEERAAMAL
ncbi:hypothetical protein G7Y89_g10073 [Cudoniella acicularis]|uniref:Pentatricopeptide repeat protein n=1 Tax=Cudoniella acicularis TaxID=354080 RepID=A0A8H4RFQ7_9HELO|nr:hypothetical protein G7Y89_g10073 [Cudoniella acicularis]